MSLRRFIKKVRNRARFPAESEAQDSQPEEWHPQISTTFSTEGLHGDSVPLLPRPAESEAQDLQPQDPQPQGPATFTTEGPNDDSIPLLPPPAESSPVLPVSPRRRHYRDIIRRFFSFRRRRSSEPASRQADLDAILANLELAAAGLEREPASRQADLDAILANLELAAREAGLGREFAVWLHHPDLDVAVVNLELDNRHVQPNYEALDHLENLLASRAARPNPAILDDDTLQYLDDESDLRYLPSLDIEFDRIQYDPETMRGFEDVFARQEARDRQANAESRAGREAGSR
ncbi:uncharacterized protein PGRI_079660 [Penicillium griseofulvum]|uniref:Uncharacterized protein n=1 Tax=Penicillium patulum TaxID=5078 RepID=A0A135LUS3_PENPA|nr:uncharacterized protein PGRI_079660 [Penicillium griseofulvum]KXG52710.1 hypothetical protein PGRI_079660 [Penicillium griseofulvum]